MLKLHVTNKTSHLCSCFLNLLWVIVSSCLTVIESVSLKEGVTVSDELAENNRLLNDGRGVPLFVSGKEIKLVKTYGRE